jgi:hydroxymethylglutaryl-CoA synthase
VTGPAAGGGTQEPVGVLAYGAYVPALRIDRKEIGRHWNAGGRGTRSVAGADEDAVTMAVEAAEAALGEAGGADLDAILLATCSAPYAEHDSVGTLAQALRARPDVETATLGGTPRASAAALRQALDAVAAGRLGRVLVVASDARRGEPGTDLEGQLGAGAVALVVGRGAPLLVPAGAATGGQPLLDRWRPAEAAAVRGYDARFARDKGYLGAVRAAGDALRARGVEPREAGHLALQQPDDRAAGEAARALGSAPDRVVDAAAGVGDLGCAGMPLALVGALERGAAGDPVLAVAYGSGVADALAWRVARPAPRHDTLEALGRETTALEYPAFLRLTGALRPGGEPARAGLPPTSPLLWREGPDLLGLLAARCAACGYLNSPPESRRLCVRCGGRDLTRVARARRGTVHTFGINHYMPPPLESPLPVVIADMADGSRYLALGTGLPADLLRIGLPVELCLRVLYEERGARVYAYKFRHDRAGAAAGPPPAARA